MGPSLGGMVVVAFAAVVPGGARRLLSISGSSAASPFAIALRSLQREAIMSDPAWAAGQYADTEHGPQSGMRIARKLGTITYRSADEWRGRFARSGLSPVGRKAVARVREARSRRVRPRFDVESYLEAQAERFVRMFDPNCYLYLSRAMDYFDIAAHGDAVSVYRRADLESALVIGVESDLLFTIREQAQIAADLEAPACRPHSRPCPASKDTTRSSWTCRASTPRSAPFWPDFLA